MKDPLLPDIDNQIVYPMMRALAERHDVMFKGWHEPVYGKKIHIGDTCPTCNTHFNGLKQDIENLTKYYVEQAIKSEIIRILEGLRQEANSYSNDGDFSDNATSLVEAIPIDTLNNLIEELKK